MPEWIEWLVNGNQRRRTDDPRCRDTVPGQISPRFCDSNSAPISPALNSMFPRGFGGVVGWVGMSKMSYVYLALGMGQGSVLICSFVYER